METVTSEDDFENGSASEPDDEEVHRVDIIANIANFEYQLMNADAIPVAVMFYENTSTSSILAYEAFKELSVTYDNFHYLMVDVSESENISKKYHIEYFPTVICFIRMEEVDRITVEDEDKIDDMEKLILKHRHS